MCGGGERGCGGGESDGGGGGDGEEVCGLEARMKGGK